MMQYFFPRSGDLPAATAVYTVVASSVDNDDVEMQRKQASAPPFLPSSSRQQSMMPPMPPMPPMPMLPPMPPRSPLSSPPRSSAASFPPPSSQSPPCVRRYHLRCLRHFCLCLLGVGIFVAGIVLLVDAGHRGVHLVTVIKHTHHGLIPTDDDEAVTRCHGDGCTERYWAIWILAAGIISMTCILCHLCAWADSVYRSLEE